MRGIVALVVSGATATWGMFEAGHSAVKPVWNEFSAGDED